jgi:hypothetical protein
MNLSSVLLDGAGHEPKKTVETRSFDKRWGTALIRRKRTSSATGLWTGFQASIRLIFRANVCGFL